MTIPLSHFDLPLEFIRRFHPMRTSRKKTGPAAYVFDHYRLRFFQNLITAESVPSETAWSIWNYPTEPCNFKPVVRRIEHGIRAILPQQEELLAMSMESSTNEEFVNPKLTRFRKEGAGISARTDDLLTLDRD
jgi:hypothetical protein